MTGIRAIGKRTQAMIDALAGITAELGTMTRLYLTPEHKRAAALVGEWMRGGGRRSPRQSATSRRLAHRHGGRRRPL